MISLFVRPYPIWSDIKDRSKATSQFAKAILCDKMERDNGPLGSEHLYVDLIKNIFHIVNRYHQQNFLPMTFSKLQWQC